MPMHNPNGAKEISRMTACHVSDVVGVHLKSFPGFFLSELGARFLLCLYEEILRDSSGIALVYEEHDRVRGFVAGTTSPRGFYGRLLARRWHRFALASIAPVLCNPRIVPRLLNALHKKHEEPDDECALLMSIAVDPHAQGRGTGIALVHAFLSECKSRGVSSVHLTTDRFDNDHANRFYSKLGFRVSREIVTPQGRVMNDYRIEIPEIPSLQCGTEADVTRRSV